MMEENLSFSKEGYG